VCTEFSNDFKRAKEKFNNQKEKPKNHLEIQSIFKGLQPLKTTRSLFVSKNISKMLRKLSRESGLEI